MRVHAEDPGGNEYRVRDKNTGAALPYARWADTDTGEIGVFRQNENGRPATDENGDFVEEVRRADFKLTLGDIVIAETP